MANYIDQLMISIGVDPQQAREGFNQISKAAQKTDTEFVSLADKWKGVVGGIVSSVIAPVAGAFAIGKLVNSYMTDVSEVATLTGAYNQKLDEWRLKRAQLARVTKEDIELYKKQKEAMTSFKIAMGDVSAKMMRSFMPVMQLAVEGLNKFTQFINRNQDNVVRFFQVTAGVITAVFLPAIIKTSAAMLASPLTWVVAALGALVVVVDDLVTYMQGGKSALSGFWSYFGTGPEIMAKLNKAFTVFKEIVRVLWKPLAVLAAGFVAFKTGAVLVHGFTTALAGVKAAMTALAAHPIVAVLFLIVSLVMWIADAWKRAGGQWSGVLDLMKGDLKDFLNLFGGLGDTLAALFAPLEAIFDNAINTIGNFFGVIFNAVKLIFAYLTGASDEAKDKIAGALWDCIGGLFNGIITGLSELISLITGAIGSLLSAIGDGLAGVPAVLQSMGAALWGVISGFFGFIWNGIKQLGTWISGLTGTTLEAIAAPFISLRGALSNGLEAIGSGIQAFFTGLVTGWKNAWGITVDVVKGVFEFFGSLWAGAGDVMSDVCGSISRYWMYLTKAIGDAVEGVTSLIGDAFSAVAGTVSGLVRAVVSFFSDGLSGAANLCTTLISGAGALIGGLVDSVRQGISTAFDLVSSLGDGILGTWSSVVSGITGAFSKGVKVITGLFTSVYDSAMSIFAGVADAIGGAFDTALQAASNFFDAVLGFFTKIPQMIASAFDIGGMIDSATSKLKEGLGGAWDKVSGFFGGGDNKSNAAAPAAAPAPGPVATAAQNMASEMSSVPVAAQTSSIVTNTYESSMRSNSNSKSSVNNITINTTSDRPGAIARAVADAMPDESNEDNYVSAADNGNFNY